MRNRFTLFAAFFMIAIICLPSIPVLAVEESAVNENDSWFVPPYATSLEVPEDLMPGFVDVDFNIEQMNAGERNPVIQEYPCVTLAEVNIADMEGFLCRAGWAGNEHDLWLIKKTGPGNLFSKPLLTGATFDLRPRVNVGYRELWTEYGAGFKRIKVHDINVNPASIEFDLILECIDFATGEIINTYPLSRRAFVNFGDLEQDSDADGLTNLLEARYHTDPENPDTDGDGIDDLHDSNPHSNLLHDSEHCALYNEVFLYEVLAHRGDKKDDTSSDRLYSVTFPDGETCSIKNYSSPILIEDVLDLQFSGKHEAYFPFDGYSAFGIVTFEEPEYQDENTATVHARFWYAPLAAHGSVYTLKKENGEWRVVDVELIWIS